MSYQTRFNLIIALCFLFAGMLNAQMFYFKDSLEVQELQTHIDKVTGNKKIDLQNQIAARLVDYNRDQAFELSQTLLKESERLSYSEGKAFALSNIGFYYFLQNDFIKSFLFQRQALEILEEKNDNELDMLIHERLGYIYYFSKANEREIIDRFGIAFNYYDEQGEKNKAATMLIIMGGGCFRTGRISDSYQYFTRFNEYTKDLEVPLIEKLIVNYSMGDIYFRKNDLENTWKYYKKCLKLMDDQFIEYIALNANIFVKIGKYYNRIQEPDSAMYYFNRALEMSGEIYYARGLMIASHSLGILYNSLGNAEKSIFHFKNAYKYGAMIDSLGSFFYHPQFHFLIDVTDESWMSSPKEFKKYTGKLGMVNALNKLALIYGTKVQKIQNKYIINKLLTLKDSIINYQLRKELVDLGLKYETQKKEQQIELLQEKSELQRSRNRQTIFIVVIIFAFIIMILILLSLYLRQNRLKVVQERTVLQQKLLRSQMNPHFIFNSLASIQNSIINEEPDKASKYLARFSKLVRNILDSSVEEFIPLEEELATIENYLELQKIRFPEKFDYSIEVDEQLDPESVQIPPMLAQPFIENSIEHGLKHKDSKGNIKIRFKLKDGMIELEVEDDGVGRQKAQEILHKIDHKHKSLATSITLERIKAINKNLKKKIALSIRDLYNDNKEPRGTFVIIRVPLTK